MALAALAMSDCDPMSYEYHSYIDFNKIVNEQARRIERMVDAATLDRLAPTLNTFGWYKREECREVEDEDTGFIVCSECGAVHDADYTAYYCWCCGRKVMP